MTPTKESLDRAREWLSKVLDGCPDCTKAGEPLDCDIASLAHLIDRCRIEAKIEALESIVTPPKSRGRSVIDRIPMRIRAVSATVIYDKLESLRAQLAARPDTPKVPRVEGA